MQTIDHAIHHHYGEGLAAAPIDGYVLGQGMSPSQAQT